MSSFEDFNLKKQLNYGIEDLGFSTPTPIQQAAFSVVLSGKDIVGIAQTGTGKTMAYMLPLLQELTFSKQIHPRILVLVPTRELVLQVVENIESFAKYMNVRVLGVYGGTNINTQKQLCAQGTDIDALIDDFFIAPEKVSIAVSGTPLDNIAQQSYAVPNFYTKINLLIRLLKDKDKFQKVLVFVSNKRSADTVFQAMEEAFGNESCVIHSNKTQNYRIRSIRQFDEGKNRILVTTDVMARGLDLEKITHVVNFDTPNYPENYMHRIGRTGRAEHQGNSILFYTEKEAPFKEAIEALMDYKIPLQEIPSNVEISEELTAEERPKIIEANNPDQNTLDSQGSFHEKKEKNKKVNQGGSYQRIIAKKYSKPKTRGDKNYNKRNKKK